MLLLSLTLHRFYFHYVTSFMLWLSLHRLASLHRAGQTAGQLDKLDTPDRPDKRNKLDKIFPYSYIDLQCLMTHFSFCICICILYINSSIHIFILKLSIFYCIYILYIFILLFCALSFIFPKQA